MLRASEVTVERTVRAELYYDLDDEWWIGARLLPRGHAESNSMAQTFMLVSVFFVSGGITSLPRPQQTGHSFVSNPEGRTSSDLTVRRVRSDLNEYIIPSSDTSLPAAGEFFRGGQKRKGKSGRGAESSHARRRSRGAGYISPAKLRQRHAGLRWECIHYCVDLPPWHGYAADVRDASGSACASRRRAAVLHEPTGSLCNDTCTRDL